MYLVLYTFIIYVLKPWGSSADIDSLPWPSLFLGRAVGGTSSKLLSKASMEFA